MAAPERSVSDMRDNPKTLNRSSFYIYNAWIIHDSLKINSTFYIWQITNVHFGRDLVLPSQILHFGHSPSFAFIVKKTFEFRPDYFF